MWPLKKSKKFAELEDHDLLVMVASEVVGNNEVEEVMLQHNMLPAFGFMKMLGMYMAELGKLGVKDFGGITDEKNQQVMNTVMNNMRLSDFFDTGILNDKMIKAQSQKTILQTSEMYKNMDRSDKRAFEKYGVQPQQTGQQQMGYGQPQQGVVGNFFDTMNAGVGSINQGLMGMNSMAYTMNNTANMARQTGQNMQNVGGAQPMPWYGNQVMGGYGMQQNAGGMPQGMQMGNGQQPTNNGQQPMNGMRNGGY